MDAVQNNKFVHLKLYRFTMQSFDSTDSVDIAEEGATTLSLKDPVREVLGGTSGNPQQYR